MSQQLPPVHNPYSPPPGNYPPPQNQYAPCPQCQNSAATPISWTLWGGFIGPKLLHHVRCMRCGMAYNGKTGKSNMTAIVLYNVILGGITLLVIGGVVSIVLIAAISG